ncbi:MAG: hypothetical protein J2P15_15420 [Micromonosporaceae bacterium]|nr:hypothetical protein [Micromonosporaceae bacterium]
MVEPQSPGGTGRANLQDEQRGAQPGDGHPGSRRARDRFRVGGWVRDRERPMPKTGGEPLRFNGEPPDGATERATEPLRFNGEPPDGATEPLRFNGEPPDGASQPARRPPAKPLRFNGEPPESVSESLRFNGEPPQTPSQPRRPWASRSPRFNGEPPDRRLPPEIDGLDDGYGRAEDAQRRARWPYWLIPLAVVCLAAIAVTGGLALMPRTPQRGDPAAANGNLPAGPLAQTSPAVSASAASPVAGARSARPSAAAPSPARTATPATTRPANNNPPPAFQTIQVEAESRSNSLGGSAQIGSFQGASGGSLVLGLGNFNRGTPGTLTVPVNVPTTGGYNLSFTYVHPDGEQTRTVVIAVSGATPIALQVSAGSTCCATRTVRITLQAGSNRITFGNPNGHAPAIDRITISQ